MAIRTDQNGTAPSIEAAGSGRPQLKRSLGLTMATALVVGNMVGSGVFSLPSSLASTGPISLLSWIFTGAGAILLALVFANLGRAYPQTGGPYAFTRRAFGDFAGFWTVWGSWIAAWAGSAAIAVVFVSYASVFLPRLGTDNVLAFAYSFWMIYGAGQEYIAQGFLLLLAGIPVYVYLRWSQSREVPDLPPIAAREGPLPDATATRPLTSVPS